MKIPVLISFGLLAALIIGFESCTRPPAYTSEVQHLDSLIHAVQSAKLTFDSIDYSVHASQLEQIKKDMKLLQSLKEITLNKEQADFFNSYNNTKRLLKDFPDQYRRIEKELERTELQLTQLKSALEKGATIDGSGNEITPAYIQKQMGIETDVASHLVEEIQEMRARLNRATTRFEEQFPQATAYLNQWTDLTTNE